MCSRRSTSHLPGGHRRLAGGSGTATATHAYPACEDNDTAYQIEEDKPNVTGYELNGKLVSHKMVSIRNLRTFVFFWFWII